MNINQALKTPPVNALIGDKSVSLLYLIGSRARGTAGPLSDIDVAVLLSPGVGRDDYGEKQNELTVALSRVLRRDDVDVVVLNYRWTAYARGGSQRKAPLFDWGNRACGV